MHYAEENFENYFNFFNSIRAIDISLPIGEQIIAVFFPYEKQTLRIIRGKCEKATTILIEANE